MSTAFHPLELGRPSLTYLATSTTTDWRTGPYVHQCLNLTNYAFQHGNQTFEAASEDPHLYQDARGRVQCSALQPLDARPGPTRPPRAGSLCPAQAGPGQPA